MTQRLTRREREREGGRGLTCLRHADVLEHKTDEPEGVQSVALDDAAAGRPGKRVSRDREEVYVCESE
jgi:hypothetical protein